MGLELRDWDLVDSVVLVICTHWQCLAHEHMCVFLLQLVVTLVNLHAILQTSHFLYLFDVLLVRSLFEQVLLSLSVNVQHLLPLVLFLLKNVLDG